MIEKFLKYLLDEKATIAEGLCEFPSQSYDKYMLQVGLYQGLQKAETSLLALLKEDDEKER